MKFQQKYFFFWKPYHFDILFFEEVNSFLPQGKSWHKNLKIYGDLASNCFEILFDDENRIVSVSFRIDFTSDYKIILNKIIKLCIRKKLLILDECLNIISPISYEKIENIITKSSRKPV